VSFLEDVIKQLRDWDAARPRSSQQAVGWSELGGCRAHMGYRLAGTWPSDDTDNWAAIRGTAIHSLLEEVITGPDVLTEIPTEYRGVPGHADIVLPGARQVWDWKSTRLASLRLWQSDPSVLRQKRIQIAGYAAGLVEAGVLPEDCEVGLVGIPVDGSFSDWWCWQEPFDRALADEGADRLQWVRDRQAAGEPLPKDMPLTFCDSYCEFVSLCRGQDDRQAGEEITDPETVAAVAAYASARDREAAAKKEKLAAGDLIRGLRGQAGDYRVSLSDPGEASEVLDEDWIRVDYAARGEQMPVTLKPGSSPRLSVTRIRRPKP
jgi:hypothetical protein